MQKGGAAEAVDCVRRLGGELLSKAPTTHQSAGCDASASTHTFEAVGRWLSSTGQTAVGNSTQTGVESLNDVLAALGLQVKIIRGCSPDGQVLVRVAAPAADPKRPPENPGVIPLHKLTPRGFVIGLREATNSGFMAGLDLYVDRMLSDKRLKPVNFLSTRIQRNVYIDVARIIVFTFQRVLMQLDDASLWGHRLQVKTTPCFEGLANVRLSRRRRMSAVGEAQLEAVFDELCAKNALHPLVPAAVQKRLYVNIFLVIAQLVEDLLAGDGQEIKCMGHRIHFKLEPQPLELMKKIMEEMPWRRFDIDEAVVAEFADELLAHSSTNISWIPDVLERIVYRGVMRIMLCITQHTVERVWFNVLGREVTMSFCSKVWEASAQESEVDAADAMMYVEEDSPLRIVSTTELEERLKDLTEQRRILKAIKELGGASFDLTADTPMLGADAPKQAGGEASGDLGSEGADGANTATGLAGGLTDEERQQAHEFQTLAHTLKLARSLSVKFDMAADVEVPYRMIADLETYSLWMPWCTYGRTFDGQAEAADGERRPNPMQPVAPGFSEAAAGEERILDGEVTFGFETGTFLGTVGDTVKYRLSLRPPVGRKRAEEVPEGAPVAAAEAAAHSVTTDNVTVGKVTIAEEGEEPLCGRVVADATNGFTYGERLVYDWRFYRQSSGHTKVELDMLFQARSVIYMPLWDSMQNMVINKMLAAFVARAELLQKKKLAAKSE